MLCAQKQYKFNCLTDETGYKQCFYDAEMNIVKEQKWNYTSDSPILAVETLYTYENRNSYA